MPTPTSRPSSKSRGAAARSDESQATAQQRPPRSVIPAAAQRPTQVAAQTQADSPPQTQLDITALLPAFNQPAANTSLFGSLSARDTFFYIRASLAQLKTIVAPAPESRRARIPDNANKEAMLAEVLAMRQEEAISESESDQSPQECLVKLLDIETQDLVELASANPRKLRESMKLALQADPTLQPKDLPTSSDALVTIALNWQVQAHKAAHGSAAVQPAPSQAAPQVPDLPPLSSLPGNTNVQQPFPVAPGPDNLPTLAELITRQQTRNPGGQGRRNTGALLDTSDEDDAEPPKKKKKSGIILQGFNYGASTSVELMLSTYTGNRPGSKSLNIDVLRGPEIMAGIIGGGSDIPSFLSRFKFWRKTAAGLPTQAEMEAHTLGRMIHMELVSYDSPKEALEKRAALEIGLRRLYAILFVEEKVHTGAVADRGEAWREIQFLMESVPIGTVECETITEAMTRRMNLEKKRLNTVKAMQEIRNRKPKGHLPDQGGAKKQPGPNRRAGQRQ